MYAQPKIGLQSILSTQSENSEKEGFFSLHGAFFLSDLIFKNNIASKNKSKLIS